MVKKTDKTVYYTKKDRPTAENILHIQQREYPKPKGKEKMWKKKKAEEIQQLEEAIEQIKLKQWFNK